MFEILPKPMKNKHVAEKLVNIVLVLEELSRVYEYKQAIEEIERALEDVEEKKMEEGKREEWKNGKKRLYLSWIKLNLFGILNISGPEDNVNGRLKEGLERLTVAYLDVLCSIYGNLDVLKIELLLKFLRKDSILQNLFK